MSATQHPQPKPKADPDTERLPKIKVGYYITVRARDQLRRLARRARRTCSAQLEVLIEEETARQHQGRDQLLDPA